MIFPYPMQTYYKNAIVNIKYIETDQNMLFKKDVFTTENVQLM